MPALIHARGASRRQARERGTGAARRAGGALSRIHPPVAACLPKKRDYFASSRSAACTATASVFAFRISFSRVRVRRCWTALMTIAPTMST